MWWRFEGAEKGRQAVLFLKKKNQKTFTTWHIEPVAGHRHGADENGAA
jgi:hypothetical protein